MIFVAQGEHDGLSVLQILRNILGLSGGMIKHIKFLDDGILLNGSRVTVRAVVREGDILSVNTSDNHAENTIEGYDIPLRIVYEDEDIVIPDKSANMPTHPSHGHYDDTVANALAFRYRNDGEPYVFRPINRLDRDTTGLLIIARNRIAAARLAASMSERRIKKEYIAILDGVLKDDAGVIETYMRRTRESIIVREVCDKEDGADYALTRYEVLLRSDKNTVVRAQPITGRTHQLRVHFAHLGCPLVGDELYGSASADIARHALHAAYISFPHPSTGTQMSFHAPLHSDMRDLMKKLFSEEVLKNEFEKEIRELGFENRKE